MLVHVIKSILSRNALGLHLLITIRIILTLSNAAKSFHFARSNIVRSFTSWWNLFHQQHKFYETRGFCVVNVLSTSGKFSKEKKTPGYWRARAKTIVQEYPYLSARDEAGESCSLHKQDHQFSNRKLADDNLPFGRTRMDFAFRVVLQSWIHDWFAIEDKCLVLRLNDRTLPLLVNITIRQYNAVCSDFSRFLFLCFYQPKHAGPTSCFDNSWFIATDTLHTWHFSHMIWKSRRCIV